MLANPPHACCQPPWQAFGAFGCRRCEARLQAGAGELVDQEGLRTEDTGSRRGRPRRAGEWGGAGDSVKQCVHRPLPAAMAAGRIDDRAAPARLIDEESIGYAADTETEGGA